MSEHQSWLIKYIQENDNFIFPKSSRQEVLSFLERPLEDLCIARPRTRLSWGIPVPFSTDHVVYVWFDALINYISAISYGVDKKRFESLWPADIHMIGKDILRQHVVYWPIMLRALGVPPPKTVIAHGWWLVEGEKVSKSRGNIVAPEEIIANYGADAFRYFLLREVRVGLDGVYSEELLANRFGSDLANDLGNLLHRSLAMAEQYFEGILPEPSGKSGKTAVKEKSLALLDKVSEAMNGYDPKTALEVIWDLINEANRYVEETKPWTLKKDPSKRDVLGDFIYNLCETLRFIGVILTAFMPNTSREILGALKVTAAPQGKDLKKWGLLKSGTVLKKGAPLFPKKG
ncbi:MAG: class I tRNA ligase family protein, partial [Candidatus Omnitrophica bacterium]|nr:class I tRNA ligase family protein [Candidatus Omnitrophota bacterium]